MNCRAQADEENRFSTPHNSFKQNYLFSKQNFITKSQIKMETRAWSCQQKNRKKPRFLANSTDFSNYVLVKNSAKKIAEILPASNTKKLS
jgi:hypothetical protein